MKEKRTRFWDLPETEQAKLYAVYGPQPKEGYAAHRISYVRELTSYESWFFGRGNFLSPSFLTQTLYKVKGTLSPLRLNRVFRDLDVQDDILRTNYCDLGDRVLAVVTSERKNAELIIYNNLQGHSSEELNTMMRKVGAAALRYPFNVTKGGLLRIYVFHTGKEEYAVLVTAAQIIMERFNIRALLRDALGLPEKGGYFVPPLPYTGQMEDKMREYWKKLLTPSLRGTSLPWELENVPPHPYKQRAYRFALSRDLFFKMNSEAKDNRMMLMNFLTVAWGLLIQVEGRHRDLCCCLIVPERKDETNDGWRPFNMVPVRQVIAKDETIGDLLKRQFQQLLVSKPYACFDWGTFDNFLGGKGRPFNHFLDFYDFLSEEQFYSAQEASPEGTAVSRHSWDAQSMKLSLYFRYTRAEASVILLYDEDSFAPGMGERIAKSYQLAMEQLMADLDKPFAVFEDHLTEKLRAEQKLQAAYQEEEKKRLQNAVSSIQLLQGVDMGTIQSFMEEGTLRTYFEGDRVEGMGKELLFVAEGTLARSIEDEEGWYRTLNIAKGGSWLNEDVMLEPEGRKTLIAAEVLSERATVLAISKEAIQTILSRYPFLWQNILKYAISQLEIYQKLWAQS